MSEQAAERMQRCLDLFDAANAEDPNLEPEGVPKELADARRMSAGLERLAPEAPDVRTRGACTPL